MGQVNRLEHWLLMASGAAGYAAAITTLTALTAYNGEVLTVTASRWSGVNVVYCRCEDSEIDAIGMSSSLLRRELSYAPLYSDRWALPTNRVGTKGDNYVVWGKFKKNITKPSVAQIDRLVDYCKGNGSDAVLWFSQSGQGANDGSTPWDECAVKKICHSTPASATINPQSYDLLVGRGRCSRFLNEGGSGAGTSGSAFLMKAGTSGSRTCLISDARERLELMGGCKHGSGAFWNAGTDGAFVNTSGNLWESINATGVGGGDPVTSNSFVFFEMPDGTLRQAIRTLSQAACAATPYSVFIEFIGATQTNLWVNSPDGDPTNITFWGGSVAGGVGASPQENYQDFIGVTFYQLLWRWADALEDTGSYHRTFNCKHLYATTQAGGVIGVGNGSVNEGTGAISKLATQHDREYHLHEIGYGQAGWYDGIGTTGSQIVPGNLTLIDCYAHHLGTEDVNGVSMTNSSDAHAVAQFGGIDGLTIVNICIEDTANPIVTYCDTATINRGALGGEPGYEFGFPEALCFTIGAGTDEKFNPPCKNITITDPLIRLPITTAAYAGTETRAISIADGDDDVYGYADQIENIRISDFYIDGAFHWGVRTKSCLDIDGGVSNREVDYGPGVVRGCHTSIMVIGTTIDEDNDIADRVETSGYFHGIESDPTNYHIRSINRSIHAKRKREFNDNIICTDDGAIFDHGAGETYPTRATWSAAATGQDVHDDNSTETTRPQVTGYATASIAGSGLVGSLHTASLGADPDGATSGLTYLWTRNGHEIEGATSATYTPTLAGTYAVYICYMAGRMPKVATASVVVTDAAAPSTDDRDTHDGGGRKPWNKQPLPSLALLRKILGVHKRETPAEIDARTRGLEEISDVMRGDADAPPSWTLPLPSPAPGPAPEVAKMLATVQADLARARAALAAAENAARRQALARYELALVHLRAEIRKREEAEEEEELINVIATAIH